MENLGFLIAVFGSLFLWSQPVFGTSFDRGSFNQKTMLMAYIRGISWATPNLNKRQRCTANMERRTALRSQNKLYDIKIQGNIMPLRGNVLIQRKESIERSSGGLLLPIESREKQASGRVLEIGPGEIIRETGSRIPMDVKKGDWVVFSRYGGDNIKYNEKDCVILNNNEIIAKFVENNTGSFSPSDIFPLGDTVLVRLIKPQNATESGLILSSEKREESRYRKGTIMSVGPGSYSMNARRLPMEVDVGDTVIFSEYAEETNGFKHDNDVYAFVRSSELLAKW